MSKFFEKFELIHNNETYDVKVQGLREEDEYDTGNYFTSLQKIVIIDENEERVTRSHSDYEEIVYEIVNRKYD